MDTLRNTTLTEVVGKAGATLAHAGLIAKGRAGGVWQRLHKASKLEGWPGGLMAYHEACLQKWRTAFEKRFTQ